MECVNHLANRCPLRYLLGWLKTRLFFEDLQKSNRTIDSVTLPIAYTLHNTRMAALGIALSRVENSVLRYFHNQ